MKQIIPTGFDTHLEQATISNMSGLSGHHHDKRELGCGFSLCFLSPAGLSNFLLPKPAGMIFTHLCCLWRHYMPGPIGEPEQS